MFTGRETLRLHCRPTTVADSRAAATAAAVAAAAVAAAAFDWLALAAALGAAALAAKRAACVGEREGLRWRAQRTALPLEALVQ